LSYLLKGGTFFFMKNRIFTPPMNIADRYHNIKSVFLGGSIEQGTAEDWQKYVSGKLQSSFNVFNPRRSDWDSSWEQNITNAQFFQQVEWELNALEHSDYIIMNFIPETMSPISLLELGKFAQPGKMFVCCPEGYWRKGNVDIFCSKYNIEMFDNIDQLINTLFNLDHDRK